MWCTFLQHSTIGVEMKLSVRRDDIMWIVEGIHDTTGEKVIVLGTRDGENWSVVGEFDEIVARVGMILPLLGQ